MSVDGSRKVNRASMDSVTVPSIPEIETGLNGGSTKQSENADADESDRNSVLIRPEEELHSVMLYPKVQLKLTIECTRAMQTHVKVKKCVLGKWYSTGMTETIGCDAGKNAEFVRLIECIYHVGIDDKQRIAFEVFDGDHFSTGEGYLFGVVICPMTDLLSPLSRFPVVIGEEVIAYLIVATQLDVTTMTTDELTIKTKDELRMGFFKSRPPTLDEVRAATPFFTEKLATYVISLEAKDLCSPNSVDPELVGETARVFLRFCRVEAKQKPTSSQCKVIWQSVPALKRPFDIVCPEIKVAHEDLTGSRKLDQPVDPELSVAVQVCVSGLERMFDLPPKIISYAQIRTKDFIEAAKFGTEMLKKKGRIRKKDKDRNRISKHFHQYENLARVEIEREKNDDKEETVERDSFDDELAAVASYREKGEIVDADESREDVESTGSHNSQSKKSHKKHKAKFGTINLRLSSELLEAHTNSGDDLYEEELLKLFKKKKKEWRRDNLITFKQACAEQARKTLSATMDTEFALEGWKLTPTFLVDLHGPCVQNLRHLCDPSKKDAVPIDSPFKGSSVLNATRVTYEAISVFVPGGIAWAYAGGGVVPPSVEHPASGFSRNVAFPLVQEYILASIDEDIVAKADGIGWCAASGDPVAAAELDQKLELIDPTGDLQKYLEPMDGSGISWGGTDFVKVTNYSGIDDINYGLLEASTIYEPCISRNANQVFFDEKEQAERSTVPTEASGKTINMMMRASNVGTGLSVDDTAEEFWHNCPEKIRKEVFSTIDADALEIMLTQAPGVSTGSQQPPSDSARAVVWCLGICPPEDTLKKMGHIFEKQMLSSSTRSTALVVVLAAETRFDLVETDPLSLTITAEPFAPLIACFDRAVARATKKLRSRGLSERGEGSLSPPPKSPWRGRRADTVGMRFQPSHNLVMIHWVTWAEIMAQAFLKEYALIESGTSKAGRLSASGGSAKSSKAGTGQRDTEQEKENFPLPKIETVKSVLHRYIPMEAAQRIVRREVESDVLGVEGEKRAEDMNGDEVVSKAGSSVRGGSEKASERGSVGTAAKATSLLGRIFAKKAAGTEDFENAASETHSVRAAKESFSDDSQRIRGYEEITDFMARFEAERQEFFSGQVRLFVNAFAREIIFKKPPISNVQVVCPPTATEKVCTTCTVT